MERTTLAAVTDIHAGSDNTALRRGTYGSQAQRLLGLLAQRVQGCACVVSLGDHVKDVDAQKDAAGIRMCRKELAASGIPVHCVAGNHDLINLTDRETARAMGLRSLHYAFDAGHVRCIALSPTSRKVRLARNHVTIDAGQIQWLRQRLKETQRPVIVFSHYPLGDPDLRRSPYWFYFVPHPWRAVIQNRREIRKALEESGNVLAVFSGHLHGGESQEINGIQYHIVPGFTESRAGMPSGEYMTITVSGRRVAVRVESVT